MKLRVARKIVGGPRVTAYRDAYVEVVLADCPPTLPLAGDNLSEGGSTALALDDEEPTMGASK